MLRLINVGFGNLIASDRVIAIVSPDSAPVKRLVQEGRERKRVNDATQGRRTRAVIQTDMLTLPFLVAGDGLSGAKATRNGFRLDG